MIRDIYRFHFDNSVSLDGIEKALAISVIAVEAIYGEAAMRIDGVFGVDRRSRTCTIDRETDLGRDLAKVFTGFLRLSMNPGRYEVEQDETHGTPGDIFQLFSRFIR